MNQLELRRAFELDACAEEKRWMVESLWADQAVGVVGGEPKCCKSFLALDMAVAVASGAPCLRRFPVTKTGRVLLFAAEDAQHIVRRRLEGIALAARVDFVSLDIHVITTPVIRLDMKADQSRLQDAVDAVQPKLLVLDPFVRLHRIDENAASEVAPLLSYLRELERRFHTAVLLVHHARKRAGHARGGQALRGSSEIHAWGDSNLYLRRNNDDLFLSIEHRAAPSTDNLALELKTCGAALALQVAEEPPSSPTSPSPSVRERIEQALSDASRPLTLKQLRSACMIRMETLCGALKPLIDEGHISKGPEGYTIMAKKTPVSVSGCPVPLQGKGNGNGKRLNLPGETESGSAGTQPDKG